MLFFPFFGWGGERKTLSFTKNELLLGLAWQVHFEKWTSMCKVLLFVAQQVQKEDRKSTRRWTSDWLKDGYVNETLNATVKSRKSCLSDLFKLQSVVSILICGWDCTTLAVMKTEKSNPTIIFNSVLQLLVCKKTNCYWKEEKKERTNVYMVIQSLITTISDRFFFSALQLACITLCILP